MELGDDLDVSTEKSVRNKEPRLRASETKASRSLRIMRLEAFNIGGKLASEVKAADMNILLAAIY